QHLHSDYTRRLEVDERGGALREVGGQPGVARIAKASLPLLDRDQRTLLVRPGALSEGLQNSALADLRDEPQAGAPDDGRLLRRGERGPARERKEPPDCDRFLPRISGRPEIC